MNRETSTIVIGGLLAYMAWQYFKDKSAANRYYAGLRMQVAKVDAKKDQVHVTFRIQNPNSLPVVIKSIVGDLYVNNKKVVNVGAFTTTVIQGNAETLYTVSGRIKLLQTVAMYANMLTSKSLGIAIRFVGTVNINDVPTPLNVTYKVI